MAYVTYVAKREIQNDTAGFVALFKDLGAGQVDTSLWRGVGPATFTRATAAACRLGSGLWKLDVAAGVPRSHYLPDLSYGGYLAEGAATQLLTAPRDMTNVAWTKTSMTAAKTSVGIDGVASACTRLTATGANATVVQPLTAAASSRTYSFYVKRITGVGNIQITQDNGGTWTTVAVTAAFTLVQLNASVLNAVFGIRIVTSGDAIDVDCNQFEAGPFATTPIPAAGARAADFLTYPSGGNVSNLGTAYAEVSTERPAGLSVGVYIALYFGSGGGALLVDATNDTVHAINDGISELATGGMTATANAVRKRASSWATGVGMSVTGDGVTPNTTGSFAGWTFGVITIGAQASILPWYGTLKNIRIYQQKVTDAILQQMTIFGTDYARIPGQSYNLEFKAEKVDRSQDVKRSAQQPIGGGPPEVLNYRSEVFVDVLTEILDEATQVPQFREFLASVQAGEVFTFDRYGTVAAPVDPRQAMLSSEKYAEQRVMTSLRQRIPFQVRLLS